MFDDLRDRLRIATKYDRLSETYLTAIALATDATQRLGEF